MTPVESSWQAIAIGAWHALLAARSARLFGGKVGIGRTSVGPMTKLLITGMSGTGKTTLLRELARRGHRVVDLDDPGWSVEVAAADCSAVIPLNA